MQDRRRRRLSRFLAEAEFPRNGRDTGFDAFGGWQELSTYPGARAVGADQDVTGRRSPVLEARGNTALRRILESDELLAVVNNAVELFAENMAQRHAAYRQLAVGVLPIAVWKIDDE